MRAWVEAWKRRSGWAESPDSWVWIKEVRNDIWVILAPVPLGGGLAKDFQYDEGEFDNFFQPMYFLAFVNGAGKPVAVGSMVEGKYPEDVLKNADAALEALKEGK